MYRIFSCRAGFSLLELLITLVLVSVLIGAIWMIYDTGFKTFYSQGTRSQVKGEAGRLFINIAGELRKCNSVTAANQTSLAFALDTDDNGLEESILYSWSGIAGEPLNRISNLTVPVVNSVNNLSFSYYDANNTVLSFPVTASQVRLVAVNLTVSDKDETFQMAARVKLRNL